MIELAAEVRLEKDPEPALAKMIEVLEAFAAKPVTEEEVNRAKAAPDQGHRTQPHPQRPHRRGVDRVGGDGRLALFFIHRDRVNALKTEDVQRVATNYLIESNRTSGIFYPTKDPIRTTNPPPPDVVAAWSRTTRAARK